MKKAGRLKTILFLCVVGAAIMLLGLFLTDHVLILSTVIIVLGFVLFLAGIIISLGHLK